MAGLVGAIARGLDRKSGVPLKDAESLFKEVFGGALSRSGTAVSWQTALQVASVLACCKVIAEGIAQVPWKLYRRQNGRVEANDHPLADLIHRSPNDWQTSFEFRETIAMHVILTGNAFVFVSRAVGGAVLELIAYPPGAVTVKRAADMSLSYRVRLDDGRLVDIPPANMWHIRGASWTGWLGMDSVRLAREAIGLSIATEESQAEQHRDGLKIPGAYSVEGPLSPEQHGLMTEWLKKHQDNPGLPMVLDRGAKWLAQQMTGVDAQHLETRKHQVEEVCRVFRVMPIMIGQADKAATYASAEQMFLAHVIHTLGPWFERLEQSADVNLLSKEERRQGYYTKFNANALMRGAAKDRADFYAKALGAGGTPAWMSQDEVRALEDMDPRGGPADELSAGTMNKPAANVPEGEG